MKKNLIQWLRPALFILAGAGVGLIYYRFFGCASGCAITSNPLAIALYMGLVGWLISGIFTPKQKET